MAVDRLLCSVLPMRDHALLLPLQVAGSVNGVTAAQLDVKPRGLPLEVIEQAIWRARKARLRVLGAFRVCNSMVRVRHCMSLLVAP